MKGLHKNSLRNEDNPHQWMIDDARMELIQQIKAEVLRLIRETDGPGSQYGFGKMSACNRILNFLDTIQEYPVCDGLEEEIYNYANTIAEGTPLFEIIPQTARHFYELGCRRTAEKYDEIEYKRQRADVCEGLEEAVVDYFEGYWPGMETAEQCNTDLHFTPPAIMRLARHFAQWGAEHRGSSEIPNDLEEAARHSEILTYPMPEDGDMEKVFKVQEARIFHEIGFITGAKWQEEQIMKELRSYCLDEMERFQGADAGSRAAREVYYDIIGYLDNHERR